MKDSKRLLIAVDNSEAPHKAVAYVSAMIDGRPGCYLCLLQRLPQGPHLSTADLRIHGTSN